MNEENTEDSAAETARPITTLSTLMALVAVLAISPSMRSGATSLGPVLDGVESAFGVGAIASGVLSALPCLVFAGVGALAVPASRRFGLTPVITVGMLVSTIGLAARPFVSNFAAFLLLTIAALAGPALGNVIVPAWIKLHKAGRAVLLLTVYGSLLPIGGALGSALGAPIAGPDGSGWRTALVVWAPVALLAVIAWGVAQRIVRRDAPPAARADGAATGSLFRSRTAVALMTMFGLQSLNAYVQFGQLPVILDSLGVDRTSAGAMVAVINVWAIVGGLVMPKVVDVSKHLRLIALAFGIITATGYVGLLLAPGAAWLWICLLGFGGFAFPLGVTLIPARSRTAGTTARLSGMVQPGAYLVAAVGPIVVGIVLQATGSVPLVLGFLIAVSLTMGVIGYRAAAPIFVDDELAFA